MKTTPLTEKQVQDLTECIRDAYLEECVAAEKSSEWCECLTSDEHERNLRLAAERNKREKE